jgi:hypothetical protein
MLQLTEVAAQQPWQGFLCSGVRTCAAVIDIEALAAAAATAAGGGRSNRKQVDLAGASSA